MFAVDNTGAWVAGAFALLAGIIAGVSQIRAVARQQQTAERFNVITGYDKLVEDLQAEVSITRAETREARKEAEEARKQASDAHAMFYECELRSHSQDLQIRRLEEGLDALRATVAKYHEAFGPEPRGFEDQPSFWDNPEEEGETE